MSSGLQCMCERGFNLSFTVSCSITLSLLPLIISLCISLTILHISVPVRPSCLLFLSLIYALPSSSYLHSALSPLSDSIPYSPFSYLFSIGSIFSGCVFFPSLSVLRGRHKGGVCVWVCVCEREQNHLIKVFLKVILLILLHVNYFFHHIEIN